MRILDHLLAIISWIIVAVILVLLHMSFPSVVKNLVTISWPRINIEQTEDAPVIISAQYLDGSLADGEGIDLVQKHCLGCHSAQLITQNRMSRDRWEYTIRWMQRTQGLWDLGSDEPVVLDYLAEYYAPQKVGRRANLQLDEEDWYQLSE